MQCILPCELRADYHLDTKSAHLVLLALKDLSQIVLVFYLQLSQESLRWAHSIPAPEKGCLLLAHPLVFLGRQKYFHQAAILILGESSVAF